MPERSSNIDPKENVLPFNVQSARLLTKSGKESNVYSVDVKDKSFQNVNIVLKENRRTELANEKEMSKLKAFYDFIKSDPDFGRFVAEANFIVARNKPTEPARPFVVQKPIPGKRVEALSDKELYSDSTLLPELLEFVEACIKIIKKARETGRKIPDLYSDTRYFLGNFLHNPRFSGNIIISENNSASGQRVNFVDIGQVSGKAKDYKLKKALAPIDDALQLAQLRRW